MALARVDKTKYMNTGIHDTRLAQNVLSHDTHRAKDFPCLLSLARSLPPPCVYYFNTLLKYTHTHTQNHSGRQAARIEVPMLVKEGAAMIRAGRHRLDNRREVILIIAPSDSSHDGQNIRRAAPRRRVLLTITIARIVRIARLRKVGPI